MYTYPQLVSQSVIDEAGTPRGDYVELNLDLRLR
jgi:hypothetical protein